MEPTTNTKSRSVSPTLCINYDSRPIMGIIVALVAAKAGFHVGAVVGILFDPCCITRTTMTRMNRVHRNPDGQPFSAPAYTRDVFDTAHILHFDYAVGQRLARTSQLPHLGNPAHASDSDSDSSTSEAIDWGDDDGASAADSDVPIAPSHPAEGGSNGADDDRSSNDGSHGGDGNNDSDDDNDDDDDDNDDDNDDDDYD